MTAGHAAIANDAMAPSLRRVVGFSLACLVAGVWLYHGLYNKLLGGEPRHLLIVQSVPGLDGALGEAVVIAVGAFEVLLAVWVLIGWRPIACAGVQTAALLAMNGVELTWARPHLLWPAGLLPVNVGFLALAWTSAALREGSELYRLRRHPFAVKARFRHCLVLTYAVPREVLAPLLPPGLELDTHGPFGFVAVAAVQTRGLRPAWLPARLGQNFFLTGYRAFVKFRTPDGRTLRGLRILRSDADRRLMVFGGNLLTHYNYRPCQAEMVERDGRLELRIDTPDGRGDLRVVADISSASDTLPDGSPFQTLRDARRFAGPLPYTFDYEPQTHSIIAIKGVRQNWNPRPIKADVPECGFLRHPPFDKAVPILASAFHVHDIDYLWERGVRHALKEEPS